MDRQIKIIVTQLVAKINELEMRLSTIEEQNNLPFYKELKNGEIEKVENRSKKQRSSEGR